MVCGYIIAFLSYTLLNVLSRVRPARASRSHKVNFLNHPIPPNNIRTQDALWTRPFCYKVHFHIMSLIIHNVNRQSYNILRTTYWHMDELCLFKQNSLYDCMKWWWRQNAAISYWLRMSKASSTLAEKLNRDFLECGICLDRFQKPLALPCLHSFCHRY